MKNKILKLFTFVVFAQIFLYACCNDEYNVFITSIDLTVIDNSDNDISVVSNADFSLSLQPAFQTEQISSLIKQSGILTTAYATSCDKEYHVINRVTDINVEANVPLFGIAAGESLNEHIIARYHFDATGMFTIDDMILILNDRLNIYDDYSLVFDSAIPADTTVSFKITLTFENDTQLESTSSEVTFE